MLALMIFKTLDGMGPRCTVTGSRCGLSKPSGNCLSVNRTICPSLLKLEQEGCIDSEWGLSDNKWPRAPLASGPRASAGSILARFLEASSCPDDAVTRRNAASRTTGRGEQDTRDEIGLPLIP